MPPCKFTLIKTSFKNDSLNYVCLNCLSVGQNLINNYCKNFRHDSMFCNFKIVEIFDINSKFLGQSFECDCCFIRFSKPVLTFCHRKRVNALCKEKTCTKKNLCIHKASQGIYPVNVNFSCCAINKNKSCKSCGFKINNDEIISKFDEIPIFCKNNIEQLTFQSFITQCTKPIKKEKVVVDLEKEGNIFLLYFY